VILADRYLPAKAWWVATHWLAVNGTIVLRGRMTQTPRRNDEPVTRVAAVERRQPAEM
jgi:hypothetical protein